MARRIPPSVLRVGRAHRHANWPRRIRRLITGLLALVLLGALIAGATLAYLQIKVKGGNQEVPNLVEQAPREPMNVLVLGSDSRDALTDQERQSFGTIPGKRADTIMLLHLDERREKVVLVHFPRDLRVVDPQGKEGKLNGIYSQGPDAVVSTISTLTGLPIHHYLEVDFNGFNQISRELGGVQVYFDRAIKDRDSGLDQPKGCNTIEGAQALAFVRARKIDDDFGRIRRQQLFLKLMADKIATPGIVLRPDKVLSLVNVFSANVKHDAELSLSDIKTIGLRLRKFNSGNLDMRVVPSTGAKIQGVDYVLAIESQSKALFKAIADGSPLPPYGRTGVSAIDPTDVKVSLLNGTVVDKLAATEADVLRAKGFQVFIDGNAPPHERTTVYYDEGYLEQAQLLVPIYPMSALMLKPSSLVSNAPVAVVFGNDFAATKVAASPSPGASVAPSPAAVTPTVPVAPSPQPTPAVRDLVRACEGSAQAIN